MAWIYCMWKLSICCVYMQFVIIFAFSREIHPFISPRSVISLKLPKSLSRKRAKLTFKTMWVFLSKSLWKHLVNWNHFISIKLMLGNCINIKIIKFVLLLCTFFELDNCYCCKLYNYLSIYSSTDELKGRHLRWFDGLF